MLSDGSNAFTWNARNQVATLDNVSLQYDAFGRRVKNLAGTSFLYDGANAVQELSGTTVTANVLSGGIDEVFSRSDSSGAFAQLKDALGSTVALVDSSGNVDTSYAYDPYGNTSVTGTSNTNEFQYTGRENEGNGLYYYRARYYSPVLHRFISEDPLGLIGSGPDFYAYAFDNPVDLRDPSGLNPGLPIPNSALPNSPPLGGRPLCRCPDPPAMPPGVNLVDNINTAENSKWLVFAAPRLIWFYGQVRNHGPWDYKQIRVMNDFDSFSSPYQDLGNFNFGMTGAAAGIELQVLLRAAGWAQGRAGTSTPEWGNWYGSAPYGDDPDDQAQIIAGFNYYKNKCYKK